MVASLKEQFKAARRVSAPLVAISTPDPGSTVRWIALTLSSNGDEKPIVQWDIVRGLRGVNAMGKAVMSELIGEEAPENFTGPPGLAVTLEAADKMPEKGVLCLHGVSRFLDDATVIQGIWNLRDLYKENFRTLLMLGPSFSWPPELAMDVLMLDEVYPTEAEIGETVNELHENAGLELPSKDTLAKCVDALRGLPSFPVETSTAMALSRNGGISVDSLWDLKRKTIDQTKGLTMWRGSEALEDIGGLKVLVDFYRRLMTGKRPFNAVVFVDEIEKSLAGSSGSVTDNTGINQDQLLKLLEYMQDSNANGVISIGMPGTGKSLSAKTAAAVANVPTIKLDLGEAKESWVGSSEANMRTILRVIQSVSGGSALFVATCNKIAVLPPELRRRFSLGTFYFDMPDEEEREAIWAIHGRKYGVDVTKELRPDDSKYVGSDIESICDKADRLGCTLKEAAEYHVSVYDSDPEAVDRLRREASGKYLSASHPGVYRLTPQESVGRKPSRAVELDDEF